MQQRPVKWLGVKLVFSSSSKSATGYDPIHPHSTIHVEAPLLARTAVFPHAANVARSKAPSWLKPAASCPPGGSQNERKHPWGNSSHRQEKMGGKSTQGSHRIKQNSLQFFDQIKQDDKAFSINASTKGVGPCQGDAHSASDSTPTAC